MTSASLHDIKQELRTLKSQQLADLCLRLAKYKRENKELLSYLLYEAQDENQFIEHVKQETSYLFETIPNSNLYFVKKTVRKILRYVNKQIKFSSIKATEVDLRIFFCLKILEAKIPISKSPVLMNLYRQQLKKIDAVMDKLPEDLQADFERDYLILREV
jgi:hypothetical protein